MKEFWNSRPIRKLRRDRAAMLCLALILAYTVAAVLVGFGVFGDAYETRYGDKYMEPSFDSVATVLGTDRQGRSIFYRAIHSAKIAMFVGFVSSLIGVAIGSVLGAIAGYFGKFVDDLIVWLYSTVQSIPYLLLLVVLSYIGQKAFGGKGVLAMCITFSATFWVGPCRVVRGEVLKLREAEYVQAARAMGYGHWRILLRHIMPNTMHLVLVNFALLFVGAIKSEVILSYLGLGVIGEPSWGIMINHARAELINGFFWQIGAAAFSMFVLVLSFNIFADALQDALDPKAL